MMIPELVSEDLPGCGVVLKRLPVTIGRDSDADLRLSDPYVSHYHCKIDQISGTLVVRDLGSKNGTFVNGMYVTQSHLLPGDRLSIGDTKFRARYRRQNGAGREQEAR